MSSLAIDDSIYKAESVAVHEGAIVLMMRNGRKIEAPVWLFDELEGFTSSELSDIEVIEGGRGVMIGDREAITVARVMGLDAATTGSRGSGLSLL